MRFYFIFSVFMVIRGWGVGEFIIFYFDDVGLGLLLVWFGGSGSLRSFRFCGVNSWIYGVGYGSWFFVKVMVFFIFFKGVSIGI